MAEQINEMKAFFESKLAERDSKIDEMKDLIDQLTNTVLRGQVRTN